MIHTRAQRVLLALACASTLCAAPVFAVAAAAEEEVADEPTNPEAAIAAAIAADTAEAKALLKRSADFLAAQEKFGFDAELSFDVWQENGQVLEFGATREVTLRRPDRLRVDARTREGTERHLYFDGKTISIDLPDENAYVSVEKPGTLDAAIDYLVDDLETPAPLHDFLKSNFYADVDDQIRSGYVIGTETLGDRTCEHLAFRTAIVDFQIWVEAGDRPLPCRLVITYKRAAGSPEFRAAFTDWDLSPLTWDRTFAYDPPEDAERLSVQARVQELRDAVEADQ
jgi:hypothetical protein